MIRTRFMTHFFKKAIQKIEKPEALKDAIVIGFDTEYTPNRKLISYQLCLDPKHPVLFRPPLSWEILLKRIEKLLGRKIKCRETIYLVCYWSTAELQHLAIDGVMYKQWRPGVYDATWYIDGATMDTRRRKLRILDVCQFFPFQTLKAAAGYFGLRKGRYNVANLSRENLKDPRFIKYALQDARIVKKLFDGLRTFVWDQLGVDIIVYRTMAAAALACFRHSYLKSNIEVPDVLIRKIGLFATHGGAVATYYRGERAGLFHLYDAPSQWPQAALLLKELPDGRDWFRPRSLRQALRYHGLAAVRFRFPSGHRYPCLPVENAAGLYYPLSGVSYCTLEEVRLALEMGAKIRRVPYWPIYCYERGSDAVARYMWDFLQKKAVADSNGDSEGRAIYKKILNALIGKFLQRTDYISISEIVRASKSAGMSTVDYVSTYSIEEDKKEGLIHSINNTGPGWMPEWFALIVGYARASMFEAAWKCNALAITSDSMIVQSELADSYLTFRGIRYDLKGSADTFVSYREKLYSLLKDGEFVYTAAHSNDIESKEVLEMLRTFHEHDTIEYRRRRVATLTDQVKTGIKWGSEVVSNEVHDLSYPDRAIVAPDGFIWPLAAVPYMGETNEENEVGNDGPNIFTGEKT